MPFVLLALPTRETITYARYDSQRMGIRLPTCCNFNTLVMKLLASLVLLVIQVAVPQQLDSCHLDWPSPRQISPDTIEVVYPQILKNGSSLFVVWPEGDAAQYDVLFTRSTDGGVTWLGPQALYPPTDGNIPGIVSATSSGDWIYVAWDGCDPCPPDPNPSYHTHLQRSSDFGQSWFPIQRLVRGFRGPLAASGSNVFINFVDSSNQSRILRSTDYGASFLLLPSIPPELGSYRFNAFAASSSLLHGVATGPATPPNGSSETRYYRSTDNGFTWQGPQILSTVDQYNSRVRDVAVDEAGRIYVAWIDGKYGGFFTGTVLLRCSTDGGTTFGPEQILSANNAFVYTMDIQDSIVAIIWDSNENGNWLYSHVYYTISRDFGETFCEPGRVEHSFFTTESPDVAVGPALNIVATRGDSGAPGGTSVFFTHSDLVVSIPITHDDTPNDFALYKPYPNPFNPSTEIKFSLPEAGTVSLVIYDVLGRQVAELATGYREAGYHSVTWNALNHASGIYFAHFNVTDSQGNGKYTKVNKLVLMK